MRKRIVREQTPVNVEEFTKEIERRIQVKKDLVYITSRLEKVSFSEAKRLISRGNTWGCIKKEVKILEGIEI